MTPLSLLCRWMKNLNQGSDGSMVDDLLQLSYLQRLARQKIVEMEVRNILHASMLSLFCFNQVSDSTRVSDPSTHRCGYITAMYQHQLGMRLGQLLMPT